MSLYLDFARVLGTLLVLFLLTPGGAEAQLPEIADLEVQLSEARQSRGLPLLVRDSQADKTAESYAEELAGRGVISHRDSRGGRAADRFSWTGRHVTLGEILGAGESLDSLVPAWLNSPGHRRILLSSRWSSWGLGLSKSGKVWVAVVLFLEEGSPSGHSSP